MSVSSSDSGGMFGDMFAPDEKEIARTFDYQFALPPFDQQVNQQGNQEQQQDDKNSSWSKACISLEGIGQEYGQVSERTGFTIWDAADVLAHYMVRVPSSENSLDGGLPFFKGKRVVELGTGLGLCGILATHLMPSRIVLTDGDDLVLEKTRSNCVRNGVNESCVIKKLRWGVKEVEEFLTGEDEEGFDTVFGSDIIYDEDKLEVLFATVSRLLACSKNGVFVVAYRRRHVSINLIFEQAMKSGFEVNDIGDAGDLFVFTPMEKDVGVVEVVGGGEGSGGNDEEDGR